MNKVINEYSCDVCNKIVQWLEYIDYKNIDYKEYHSTRGGGFWKTEHIDVCKECMPDIKKTLFQRMFKWNQPC